MKQLNGERGRQWKWRDSRSIDGSYDYGVEMQRKPSPKFILYEWDPVFLLTATGHDLVVGYGHFSGDQPQQQLQNDSTWSWSVPKYEFNEYCDFRQQQKIN